MHMFFLSILLVGLQGQVIFAGKQKQRNCAVPDVQNTAEH